MECYTWFYTLSDEHNTEEVVKKARQEIDNAYKYAPAEYKGEIEIMKELYCFVNFFIQDNTLLTFWGIYVPVENYVDVFRTVDEFQYNSSELRSYSETIEFIKLMENTTGKKIITDKVTNRLLMFWNEYPSGLIKFG